MRHVTLEGRSVAVHVEQPSTPNGVDVILVHGAGFDHTAWRYQTRFLAGRGYRALAPDLPGHGESESPTLGSIEEMAEWIWHLADAFDAARPVLMGHSMGSLVTLQAATSQPDRVLALVLLATSDRMAVHPDLLTAAEQRDDHAIDLMVGWMHTGLQRYGGHRSAGSWTAGTSRRTLERNLASLGSDLAACNAFDPTAVAASVDAPTLIVSGGSDKMTRSSAADRLAGLMGDSDHVVLDGAGHMALSEQSESVNVVVLRFLSNVEVSVR